MKEMAHSVVSVATNAASAAQTASTASEDAKESRQVIQGAIDAIGMLAADVEGATSIDLRRYRCVACDRGELYSLAA